MTENTMTPQTPTFGAEDRTMTPHTPSGQQESTMRAALARATTQEQGR